MDGEAAHYFANVGSTISVDLGRAFAGYTSAPTYATSGAVNGAASVSGKTLTFRPTRCGLASWRVTVTDGTGSSMSKDMVAHVTAAGAACP